jgi:outer membrane immunogenic protein
MKQILRKIILVAVCMSSITAFAATEEVAQTNTTPNQAAKMEQDFDALGGNSVLLDKARALNPEVHTTIIQNRIVDRTTRFELAGEYNNTIGGDTYINSGTYGLNAQFHFNNHWSLGARYGQTFNKLTSEGDALVDQALADRIAKPEAANPVVPDIDYPKGQTMGFLNYYPIYGKLSWLGKSVSHFDIYGQLGYGTISLKSGDTNATSAGLGMGIWGYENLTTRLEVRYMDYTAKYFNRSIKLGVTSASMQVGWLF